MVTIREVAEYCGVSVTTVSKALNGKTDISEATRQRVVQAAALLGYTPNHAAQMLKSNLNKDIGVILADESGSGLTHSFFAHILDSYRKYLEYYGYQLTILNTSQNITENTPFLSQIISRGLSGAFIVCIDYNNPQIRQLLNSMIPCVMVDYQSEGNGVSIFSDDYGGMRDLVEYVVGMGHRKIAYIHGEADSLVTRIRLKAFTEVMEENDIEIPEGYIRPSVYRITNESYIETIRLVQQAERPTCILYPDDEACMGGIRALSDLGLRVPEDISVAGFDGINLHLYTNPQLTTVIQNTDEIGRAAAKIHREMIESGNHIMPSQVKEIPTKLFEGKTVKDLRG